MDCVVGCAADWGCDWEGGGEFVCAALAVAGGVDIPFVSGAGDAMVVWVGSVGLVMWVWLWLMRRAVALRAALALRLCVGLESGVKARYEQLH